MNGAAVVFGILAAVMHGTAFVIYCIQTKLGSSKPNAATWSLWAFLATVNALTYKGVSGDIVATLQFFMGSAACIGTFLFALAIGKFSRLKVFEWSLFALGMVASVIWLVFRNAVFANMIVLVTIAISFVPTVVGVWRDPHQEAPFPWVIWTSAYLLTTLTVVMRWHGEKAALVAPIFLLLAHGWVVWLSAPGRKSLCAKREALR
jgi:hypothetical protein